MNYTAIIYSLLLASALTACSSEDTPSEMKDWNNSSFWFDSADASAYSTFYKPSVGYIGDPMPFYDPVAGDFKILYLQEFRPNAATFHPVWALSTKDCASYTNLGELIPTGTAAEMDGAIGTGSTIYNDTDQTYYTFYTGHSVNPALTGLGEAVMVATSKDFATWTKDPSFMLRPDAEYSSTDFRDPFVFKGEDALFHMIVSTTRDGKGVLAEYTSSDLHHWDSKGVFMTMMWDRFYECPDVFRMGDWWYLVYSEKHAAVRKVQYFKGRTLEELKAATADDAGIWPDMREGMLDTRAFYAGKTASNGTDRYIWGWCPTRPGNDNTNVGAYPAEPDWAGALVAHRLLQNPDGSLALAPAQGILNKFPVSSLSSSKVMERKGDVREEAGNFSLGADSHILLPRLETENVISFTVTTQGAEDRFGVSFSRGSDSKKYYSFVFNPEGPDRRKINFEEEGEEGKGFIGGADGNIFSTPADNSYDVTIITDNSVCVVYVNGEIANTGRVYGANKNCWSINSYNGQIRVTDLKVSQK